MVTLVFFPFNGKYKKHQNTEGDPIYKSAIVQKKAHNNERLVRFQPLGGVSWLNYTQL